MANQANIDNNSGIGQSRWRLLLGHLVIACLLYELLSGIAIWLLPFGSVSQLSVIIHTVIGLLALVPVSWFAVTHSWRRRYDSGDDFQIVAHISLAVLAICLVSGLLLTVQAVLATRINYSAVTIHLLSSLALGAFVFLHMLLKASSERAPGNSAGKRNRAVYLGISVLFSAAILGVTQLWSLQIKPEPVNMAFDDDYDWSFGDDRPFAPSLARLAQPDWEVNMQAGLAAVLGPEQLGELAALIDALPKGGDGPISSVRTALEILPVSAEQKREAGKALDTAITRLRESGAINPAALEGSESCGRSGCHEAIYREWKPSAHGFSASDELFLAVQAAMAEERSPTHTRSCAGCHDPVSLFSGSRDGDQFTTSTLGIHEGNSCLICHSIIETNSDGNSEYVMQIPQRYLFESGEGSGSRLLSDFLIRSYPEHHVATYKRPLYKDSEFCAGCHKQVPGPELSSGIGRAQDQNEYDSWQNSRWYHEDEPDKRIECRECHMPLVEGLEPASGDDIDTYRTADDGKHRSHRFLASNMYIPVKQDLDGGQEQAEQTIAWLRGEIEIPEIADKWTDGAMVEIELLTPETVAPGEIISLKVLLRNNKTGHDFPAGPLDVLESWVEVTVSDENGNVILELGGENNPDPTVDTPLVYKADWYDRQGMPVERHNLWDVVGSSYKRVLETGQEDIIDVPFRCPTMSRPRLSGTAGVDETGERHSDVVLSVASEQILELHVSARLLFRKANPRFLELVYGFDAGIEAPIIELVKTDSVIKVASAGAPAGDVE